MQVVQINSISKTYKSGVFRKRTVAALKEVSLTVSAGEIFGLLGPNGAGKTTLVKILLSIVHPTSGDATILDMPITDKAVRERCGYLPENHRYPIFLTGLDTLLFFGRLNGLKESILKEKAESLLQRVGLSEWRKVKIRKYSKGMLQRLGLAQALLNDPQVLFLDEPTDGVDPLGRKEIRDMLIELKNEGKTIFLNSHLLSEVEMICDRAAVLNKGGVLKMGTIPELTTTQLKYEIQVAPPITDEFLVRMRGVSSSIEGKGNILVLTVRHKSDLNSFIDVLRTEGITIEGMTPQKATLEDSFIKLIQSEADAEVHR